MKPHKTVLALLTLIFSICISATAQTTGSSTPATTTPTALSNAQRELDKEADGVKRETDALRLELRMRRLIDEVKAGRELIVRQRRELAEADVEIKVEKENSASLEKTRQLLASEAEHLLKATEQLSGAIEFKSQAIAVLEKRNDELKRSASRNRKRAFWATAAAAVLGGVLILK